MTLLDKVNTLIANMQRAITDFTAIKTALIESGADMPEGTSTSDYPAKIKEVHDKFWDTYQDNGNRTDYSCAFCNDGWNDATYNPKYPIIATSVNRLFYKNKQITDTKVPITLVGDNPYGDERHVYLPFAFCSSLKIIPSLSWSRELGIANTECIDFQGCDAIEHIGFNGELWGNVWLQKNDNIDDETLIQLVHCLKDFSQDEMAGEEFGWCYNIYLSQKCINRLFSTLMDERDAYYEGQPLEFVIMEKQWGY